MAWTSLWIRAGISPERWQHRENWWPAPSQARVWDHRKSTRDLSPGVPGSSVLRMLKAGLGGAWEKGWCTTNLAGRRFQFCSCCWATPRTWAACGIHSALFLDHSEVLWEASTSLPVLRYRSGSLGLVDLVSAAWTICISMPKFLGGPQTNLSGYYL